MGAAPAILQTRLLEVDFSGIEAVLVGVFARDPLIYRMAKLGLHAFVASHLVKEPVSLNASDGDLAKAFKAVKNAHPTPYIKAKRTVHGTGYGMTPQGMVLMFPELYKSLADAKHVQEVYFSVAPGVKPWQHALQRRAHEQTYLGGPVREGFTFLQDENAHPYGYRHYFYGVITYKPIDPSTAARLQRQHIPTILMNDRWYQIVAGPDAKSCIAFYPQSTAAGILKEALLALFADPDREHYIGDAWFGRTPLRAPIHDSILLEVPPRQWDRVVEAVYTEMLRPVEEIPIPPEWGYGEYATIGVEGKAGRSWDRMETIASPPIGIPAIYSDHTRQLPQEIPAERTYFPATEEEEEDVMDLSVRLLGKDRVVA